MTEIAQVGTTDIVEVVDLSKRFASLVVIEGLTFSLRRGEALGVVGPNGAGKTTMLNLVAGDIAPSRGVVRLNGREITKLAAHRRCRMGIGRTSQVPRPFEGLTAFENVLVGAVYGGRRGGREATDAAIAALEQAMMLGKANVHAGELTLLERKRLELARALSTSPEVLLLDEIAGGLTDGEVDELVGTIQSIHRSGMSIIWIEHVVHALLRTVDRMLAIANGSVLIEGDPQTVMDSAEVKSVYLGTEVG